VESAVGTESAGVGALFRRAPTRLLPAGSPSY
jgi:hypothetical protein